ncbi:Cytochrome c oxidase polypeptide III [hydrothermal vent metagenome]|uniref:cytochrome-c oxidase n=1 Tax=hydrothermal vent metagenome TaxID=652676 RepID=A0A3B1A6Y0_9ZZZZ
MSDSKYYLPEPSHWPLVGSVGLFVTMFGFANALPTTTDGAIGSLIPMYIGLFIMAFMMFGWFGTVIRESESGKYNAQVDTSFRMGMMWFIFSEVMFFAAFFGALFYMRQLSIPWLAGEGNNAMTNALLWENFSGGWASFGNPLVNPDPAAYPTPKDIIPATGLPLINTILLLSSSVTVTFAHHALKAGHRAKLNIWLLITVILGFAFIGLQAEEYMHAYNDLGLKLTSGSYGTTFFMLTGFHGLHVTIGAIMLTIMLLRSLKGHFTEKNHFAFEAAAWYWHFVDVVWVGLFIFVYWV